MFCFFFFLIFGVRNKKSTRFLKDIHYSSHFLLNIFAVFWTSFAEIILGCTGDFFYFFYNCVYVCEQTKYLFFISELVVYFLSNLISCLCYFSKRNMVWIFISCLFLLRSISRFMIFKIFLAKNIDFISLKKILSVFNHVEKYKYIASKKWRGIRISVAYPFK